MNRVGILSFPRYFNYGTYLQLYALQSTVAKLGYAPELIDYDPYNDSGIRKNSRGSELLNLGRSIKSQLKQITQKITATGLPFVSSERLRFQHQWKSAFQQFLEAHLKLGPKTYFSDDELMQAPPDCKAFIVGSDQVWHPIGHFKDSAYYLRFAEPLKRIAYAPSLGVSEIPEVASDWMREQIAGITHLSVRELNGAELIKQLTGRDAQVVLDPAYLLDAQAWRQFASKQPRPSRPYLFCYFLESDSYMRDRAKALADRYQLDLRLLPVHASDFERDDERINKLPGVGPAEFVDLISNAALVCTDSFHGTAFSIIFNRPFFTFRRYDNPAQSALHSRMESILAITGLEERIVDKNIVLNEHPFEVDFTAANRRITRLREVSMGFLSSAIEYAVG
jgi:hypothetical protein